MKKALSALRRLASPGASFAPHDPRAKGGRNVLGGPLRKAFERVGGDEESSNVGRKKNTSQDDFREAVEKVTAYTDELPPGARWSF